MLSLTPTHEVESSQTRPVSRIAFLISLAVLLLATLSGCAGTEPTTAPAESASAADSAQVTAPATQAPTAIQAPATAAPVEQPVSPPIPTESQPQAAAQQAAAPSETVIEYKRVGGIAGFDDRLIVNSDGTTSLRRRGKEKTATIDPASVQQLQQALTDANFAALDPEYLPSKQGNDYMEHTISSAGHTVYAVDTAIPEPLRPVLSILTDIIKQVQ